ncbi:MAG: DALR domain-containing protein, partial [Candidatus Latescibacterota bacterium]
NGFLDIEGEKMSKSLGNFLTVKDILQKYDPMTIRMFFLLKHYRSPIDFSEERIREAQSAMERLWNSYGKITRVIDAFQVREASAAPDSETIRSIEQSRGEIVAAMDDDFNTAKAMGHLFDIAKMVNSLPEDAPEAPAVMSAAQEVFDTFGYGVFGLEMETETLVEGLADDLMKLIIELRAQARKEKNWALSDRIRDGLKELGITLEDRAEGTTWKKG